MGNRAEARIKICKDVLKHLTTLDVTCGTYCASKSYDIDPKIELSQQEQIKHCRVCAKGAMLIGYIDVFNKLKLNDLNNFSTEVEDMLYVENSKIVNVLSKHFSQKQLQLIECAFEDGPVQNPRDSSGRPLVTGATLEKAIKFGNKYPDDKKRLRAIMNNMVKNNGIFKP
jgi:hypothetical protein